MFGRYVAGVSYSGDSLRTAVVQLKKRGPVLCHLSEETVADRSGAWFLRGMTGPRLTALKRVSAVSVGIDDASVFYHSFPADQAFAGKERAELIDWELSQFITDYAGSDFIKDVHPLSPGADGGNPRFLVVAASRTFVRGIESLVREHRLELRVIETNFFGSVYALSANYPEAGMKRVLLAAVEGDRLDAGVLDRGKLEGHTCAQPADRDSLIGILAGLVRTGRVDEVFLSGAGASRELVRDARPKLGVPAEVLNPARMLGVKRRYAKNNEFAGMEQRFASAIGCALRPR